MVATATMKEFLSTFTVTDDEATKIAIQEAQLYDGNFRLFTRDNCMRQWVGSTDVANYYLTILLIDVDKDPTKHLLRLTVNGTWRGAIDGLDSLPSKGIEVKLADYRTSKDVLVALCSKFIERYRKPQSAGNVKVFYDDTHFMWTWKRPSSASFVRFGDDAYHVETCPSVKLIHGEDVVPDEFRYLTSSDRDRISSGIDVEIKKYSNSYYFISAMTQVYENRVPFDRVYAWFPNSLLDEFEFVDVDGHRRYINLKRENNKLQATAIHSYTTRIETLIPEDKRFLMGKYDFYSKRAKEEVPFLGWELEACSNLSKVGTTKAAKEIKNQLPWLVMCKYDGSITPEGFETVSVPATLDYWKDSNLSSALDSVRVAPYNMRSWEHEKCGFHVHVSRSALSVLDLQKLERFVHNPNNNDFITEIAGRIAGTYQKYNHDLFSNRKKWIQNGGLEYTSSIGEFIADGITYFGGNLADIKASARSRINHYRNDLLRGIFAWIADCVAYTSLDAIVASSPNWQGLYHSATLYSVADLKYDLERSERILLLNITGSPDPDEHLKFIRFLFEKILCPDRPVFTECVKMFFPDWDLPEAVPEATRSEDWMKGLLKSKAPFKRSKNLAASQIVKGPVGKGVFQRYDALNTTNTQTIEFRMFKGTMNGTSIMRYLEFVDALIRFVASTSATDEGVHYEQFIKWLRGDPFNVARYEHLVSFIIERGFIARKDIRRRTLPTVINKDNDVTGLVAVPPKGFDKEEQKPIGFFSLPPDQLAVDPEIDPEGFFEEPDEDEEDEAVEMPPGYIPSMENFSQTVPANYTVSRVDCQCDDCRRNRGEI